MMIFPLEQLVKFTGNVYEATVAASRRSFQLAMVKDPVLEQNGNSGKVVSVAARQVFGAPNASKVCYENASQIESR